MKRLVVAALVLVLVMVGCERPASAPVAQAPQAVPADNSAWLAEAVAAAQLRSAVIARHTLYSQEFVADGAALSDTGRRDLAILADYYEVLPGPVNVQRGDASEGLYAERINTVMRGLARAGVETGRMKVADATPAGTANPVDRVVLVQLRWQPNGAPGNGPGAAPAGLAAADADPEP